MTKLESQQVLESVGRRPGVVGLGVFLVVLVLLVVVSWWLQVISRAGAGPGFSWMRLSADARLTTLLVGLPYALVAALILAVLYFVKARGQDWPAGSFLMPAVGRLLLAYIIALPIGITLAELYCLADERAFQREVAALAATDSTKLHSRKRWWPGDAQQLVGPNWR